MRRRRFKPKEYELEITRYSDEVRGIANFDDKVIFVSGALIDEKVKAKRVKNNAKFEEAQTIEILEQSPDRITPKCEFFDACGGCSLQYLSSAKQLEIKLDLVQKLFVKNNVIVEEWLNPLSSDNWGYRRKARLGVRFVYKKDKVIVGFREKHSNFLTNMDSCEVLNPKIGKNLHRLAECIEKLSIKDKIAQLEVAISESDTVLILRHLEDLTTSDKNTLANYADELGIVWQLQSGGPKTIINLDKTPNLTYSHPEHNIVMNFLANDFTQVNFALNQKMVSLAIELLDLNPDDNVLDLFCGLGNFTLPIAKYCKSVVGVEGDSGLIQRAKQNAINNHINNVDFFTADLFADNSGANWSKKQYNKALIDPARSGAAEIVPLLPTFGITQLVYVSCNPATLVRDSVILQDLGYRAKKATIMDMFSQTSHIESIVYFEK